MERESVLEIENLSKAFGKRWVVQGVSLAVRPGEVFGFLGPNGAGKTTVIKMIMGFLTPDSGRILLNGFDREKQYEKAMERIGGIVENPEMYKEFSGRRNLELYARLHKGVAPARIDEVVRLVGMEQRIEDKVKKYSLGMKQRLGVAQALLHKPNILILDEPTNGLDPAGIRELRDILKTLAHEQQVAVMVSSHMLAEMELMCDRVGIIENGVLRGVMDVSELLHEVAGQEVFIYELDNVPKALTLLHTYSAGEGQPCVVQTHDERTVTLALPRAQLPAVSRLLAAETGLLGLHAKQNTLEDAFIHITGGGTPIA
ncbi:MAG: ABC transporter ATP-binding protein [Oscillospiraceae bacterium]|jgi:ABC-2 type transport system ATP-binding protein|nr:ABC transporter ATP-binding protein [Oscillospiraceae bacterium]